MAIPLHQDPVGNGWGYPFLIVDGAVSWSGAPKGVGMNDTYRRQVIRQSLQQIITTATKEWIMRRRFGSRMMDVPFQTLFSARTMLERIVTEAITRQEPRVIAVRIGLEVFPDEGRIDVTASYTIRRVGSADTFTYPWYLERDGGI